ncbi:MAG TPA: ABC transporter permease subunit [Anaerolineales bacterium]|nr:ABC transporter permease subunit [Anaerolineales bacterium]
MENEATAPVPSPARSKHPDLIRRALENPVIRKELRGRMRGRQAFLLLTLYLLMLAVVTGVVYAGLATTQSYTGGSLQIRQTSGKAIFGTVVLLELFLICFIAPALTSGAITSEREHQTFDLLRTTTLPARSLVLGKLGSSMIYLLLLVFAALPIESIAFLLGGVGLEEIVISTVLMVVTAVFFCTLGMLLSSLLRRTLAATVASYAAIILSNILLGLAFFILAAISPVWTPGSGSQLWIATLLNVMLWVLVCTNPMLAAVMSEVILVDSQNLFYTNQSLFGGHTVWLPSPWIPFIVIYVGLALLMIAVSIRLVRRRDR